VGRAVPEHCPPRAASSRSEFCGALSAEAGYSIRSLAPEPAQLGDCLLVTTVGFKPELEQVQKIWDLAVRTLPPKRPHCTRMRMLVFCKGFWTPECNVTFDNNVGLECLALLVVAGDQRFRTMVQDAMISAPVNTLGDPVRKEALVRTLRAMGGRRLPPYISNARGGTHNDSQFILDQWKGPLEHARPRPLEAWSRTHLPVSTIEMARKFTWDSEWSNSVFMAQSQAVWRHPPQAYARVANTLTGTRPEACHYLERLWRYLFGEP